jgi:hypothetical protein
MSWATAGHSLVPLGPDWLLLWAQVGCSLVAARKSLATLLIVGRDPDDEFEDEIEDVQVFYPGEPSDPWTEQEDTTGPSAVMGTALGSWVTTDL